MSDHYCCKVCYQRYDCCTCPSEKQSVQKSPELSNVPLPSVDDVIKKNRASNGTEIMASYMLLLPKLKATLSPDDYNTAIEMTKFVQLVASYAKEEVENDRVTVESLVFQAQAMTLVQVTNATLIQVRESLGLSPLRPLSLQQRIANWALSTFGRNKYKSQHERNIRFLEECAEVVQANGLPLESAIKVLKYVYSRPVGELKKEIAAAYGTLCALASSNKIDIANEAETELVHIWANRQKIKEKNRTKPDFL